MSDLRGRGGFPRLHVLGVDLRDGDKVTQAGKRKSIIANIADVEIVDYNAKSRHMFTDFLSAMTGRAGNNHWIIDRRDQL